MSLTSSTYSLRAQRNRSSDRETPFNHQPSYITLSRTLTRLSANLIPLSNYTNTLHGDLTTQQQLTLKDLLSPLPYYRTKTLSTIEHARTLLLQLEQSAQHIKIQRVKKDVVHDLAEKRKVIRKLRGAVEELGIEAKRREREGFYEREGSGYEEGETVEELLGLPAVEEEEREQESRNQQQQRNEIGTINGTRNAAEETTTPSSPMTTTAKSPSSASSAPYPEGNKKQQPSNDLFNLRNRNPQGPSPNAANTSTTSSFSPLVPSTTAQTTTTTTENSLKSDRQTQETLTTSLLDLATQLKTQSQSLSHTLTTADKTHLDRALAGLDTNVSGLESASKKMGLLRRMSEGEGWWGRVMLYVWIWGLWAAAVGLVFLGPKLRF